MNSFIHVPVTYRFRSEAEREAEAAAANQPKATVTEPPAEETPADLDGALAALDDELAKLDELIRTNQGFPAELEVIAARRKNLVDQELDSVAAIESRSAEMAKNSAMLGNSHAPAKAAKNRYYGPGSGCPKDRRPSVQLGGTTLVEPAARGVCPGPGRTRSVVFPRIPTRGRAGQIQASGAVAVVESS